MTYMNQMLVTMPNEKLSFMSSRHVHVAVVSTSTSSVKVESDSSLNM